MSVYEEGAHARNRFENRRLTKTMEHIAFTQRYAQTRIDDEIRSVRDNLRDIRKNTGHSSGMDSEGVRSFCRGHYVSSQQRRAAEQIEQGECFDWTLTLDRDVDSVKVPDIERHQRPSRSRQMSVRRSASLKNTVSDTGAHGMPPVVAGPMDNVPQEGTFKRSSSFHGNPRRTAIRKARLENTQQRPVSKQTEGVTVKRAESFQGVTQDGRLPRSGLRRSSSTQSLRSGSRQKSVSVERIDLLPLDNVSQHKPTPRSDTEHIKLPQITKVPPGPAEIPQSSRRERARQKRKQRGATRTSDPYDIDLNTLVHDIVLEDGAVSDTASVGGGRRDRSSSRTRTNRKPVGKTLKPPRPVVAWESESTTEDLILPVVPNRQSHGSTSCPLPERGVSDTQRPSRRLSCPEEDEKILAEAENNGEEDDVFGENQEGQEETETEESREARRKKVLNARAANSGMSFAEFRSKRQGEIKVAMSPRQLRRIREQIIKQRARKDFNPSAGEQARYRHIEDKVRSFLDQEAFNLSEFGSGTDSYNSEEEGALV